MMAIKISKRMFHLASNKYSRGILNAKRDCVRYLRKQSKFIAQLDEISVKALWPRTNDIKQATKTHI